MPAWYLPKKFQPHTSRERVLYIYIHTYTVYGTNGLGCMDDDGDDGGHSLYQLYDPMRLTKNGLGNPVRVSRGIRTLISQSLELRHYLRLIRIIETICGVGDMYIHRKCVPRVFRSFERLLV